MSWLLAAYLYLFGLLGLFIGLRALFGTWTIPRAVYACLVLWPVTVPALVVLANVERVPLEGGAK